MMTILFCPGPTFDLVTPLVDIFVFGLVPGALVGCSAWAIIKAVREARAQVQVTRNDDEQKGARAVA